jgi:hypothetical protein
VSRFVIRDGAGHDARAKRGAGRVKDLLEFEKIAEIKRQSFDR